MVLIKSKKEVPQAAKQFAEEIGAPDALICDAVGEQTSQVLRDFFHKIGATLRVLEECTHWANKTELYIGLLKEVVNEDVKESDEPLVFWDNCVERRVRIDNLTAKTNLFQLHGSNAHTHTMGKEGDVSDL